ncbi:MAG: radical SAM protein [Candidatus Pacebacteria bacterium]|nr:radical SAM protein [Candidatus Paceibacterota bacterium]
MNLQLKTHSRKSNKSRVYELTLGYSCNVNCLFCSIDPRKRTINKNTNEAMNDISQARKEGFKVIGFGGGEPTIRKDIIDLVRFSKKLGFETIRIQTNGVMLRYKDFCKDLISAGVNFFKFSIHGYRPEIHDKLTMVPGSFKKSIDGLKNVQFFGARTEIDVVINRLNYRFLPQFVEYFLLSKGVSSFVLIYPMYTGRMKESAKFLGIKISEAIPYIREAAQLALSLQLDKCLIMNVPNCLFDNFDHKRASLHRKSLVTNLNLKVNMPEGVIEDADEDISRGKTKIAKCKNCFFSSECDGIWKNYIDVFGMEEFK